MYGKRLIQELELESVYSIEDFNEELQKIEESENKDVYYALVESYKTKLRNTTNLGKLVCFSSAKNIISKSSAQEDSYLIIRTGELAEQVAKQLNLDEVGKEIVRIKLLFQMEKENLINYLLTSNINSKVIEQINGVVKNIKRNPYQVSKQLEVLRKNIIHICNKMGKYNGCAEPKLVLNALNYLVASDKELYQSLENQKRI